MVKRQKTGFTLVELLVVISIIALLLSILMPGLSKARSYANQIKCAASLKQLGMGFMMYTNKYDGYIPPVNKLYGKWITRRNFRKWLNEPGIRSDKSSL